MLQFIMESTLITFLSILLAIPLAELGLRFFDEFVPPGVALQILPLLPFLSGVLIFVGVLAGAYPAFVLSSFLPALALKNIAYTNSSQSRTSFLRKSLIVFQFTIAQVLIIGTLVVGSQIHFMMTKDLGFQKDEVIYFSTPWWEKPEKATQLKTELMGMSSIKNLSLSGSPPSANGWSSSMLTYRGRNGEQKINTYRKSGDPNYLPFYNMELVAGRNVATSDTVRELVINQTLVKQLGFENPADVLGEIVEYGNAKIPIVGVVKDFHIQSMHTAIEPVMIGCEENFFHCFNIRLQSSGRSSEEVNASMAEIEKVFKKIYPDGTFNYYFLEETVKNFYQSEQRIDKLVKTATLLAIFISCMGLFGLASYVTTQRTKEIGIRKVMGASVSQITFLLTHEFMVFVLVAFVIAAPLAWFASDQWLTGFAYQTQLGFGIFVITIVGALIIAFSTVSLQTLKAANANPTDSLRSE
jgi:putative ABC transport system permease protein